MMSCVPTCSGADEFTSHTEQEEMRKIEKQLKNRFPVGSMVSEQRIVQDFLQQVTCVCVRACVRAETVRRNTVEVSTCTFTLVCCLTKRTISTVI